MKRTISKLLAIAGLSLAGLGLLSAPATAAPIRTSTNGGITCGEYPRGAGYPATYWDCITPAFDSSNAYSAAAAANGLPAAVKTVLSGQNAQIFLFNSNADYVSFTGGAVSTGVFGAVRPIVLPQHGDSIRMVAIYKNVTIAGTATSMASYYGANAIQQLGRIYGPLAPNNLKPNDPFFLAALQDDFLALSNKTTVDLPDYPSSQTVWGAAIAAAYPGKSPYEILSLRYNAVLTDRDYLLGLQMGRESNNTESGLNTFLQSYMRTTREWTKQQVFGVNPKPYVVTNGILCVETTGANVFPLTWYSCVRPYTPSVAHQSVFTYSNSNIPEQLGPPPRLWQSLLSGAGVRVYAVRNMDAAASIDSAQPFGDIGVQGVSTYGATKRSFVAADRFVTYTPGPLPIVYTFVNNPSIMSGLILHELGHQFDRTIWNNISTANNVAVAGSVRWKDHMDQDIAAFNALPCATAIDADRTANGLGGQLICNAKPAGTTNFQWLGTNGLVGSTTPRELWARAFQRRAGGAQDPYAAAVQIRLGAKMQIYMNDLWTTGAPHN